MEKLKLLLLNALLDRPYSTSIVLFIIALAINYPLALIGEPRALWLMRLIGVME